jgi:hypothetical protein
MVLTGEIPMVAEQQYRRFRRNEASEYLKETWGLDRKVSTLGKYASSGGGPRFEYAGRVPLYPQDELDTWAQSILSGLCSSTAEKPNRRTEDSSAAEKPSREAEDCGAETAPP